MVMHKSRYYVFFSKNKLISAWWDMGFTVLHSIHPVQSPERADEQNPAPVESVNSSCNWHDLQQFNWLVGFCISHVVFHSTWVGVPSPESPPNSEFGMNKHFLTTIAPS